MLFGGYVTTIFRKIERRVRLVRLPIAVAKLAQEMSFVSMLGPSLTEIQTNRPGRASDLAR